MKYNPFSNIFIYSSPFVVVITAKMNRGLMGG